MSKSNLFRIVVLIAIVAGSLSLGVRPAQAGPFPPEFQDPQYMCEEYLLGLWLDGDCLFIAPDYYPFFLISQGFYLGGFQALWNDFLAGFGCTPGQGIAFPMVKYFYGPNPNQYIYYYTEDGARCTEGLAGGIGGRTGGDEGAGTLSLKPPRNGMMNYDAGTCDENNCRITPALPHGAAADLGTIPGGADATLYVNLGGGTGSYTVCFYGEGTIYQYISGLWQAIATSIGGGKSCASASGDGSFAFAEN
ncbi:MAG: hypothetical protein HYZ26_13985 [Chloroflexi bacterium]|nr:hypothetical protein [Chloroflexota bacterium]